MDEIVAQKIESFFMQFKQQAYKKGEILIRADDNPPGVFYLKEGYVKEYAISKKGDELVINIFKPIAFFPMSWVINNTVNEYFYEAIIDVRIWRAPRDEVVAFIKDNPDVLYNLMSRVFKGTDGMLTRMTYLMSGNAYDRLITELLIYAKRFGEPARHSLSPKATAGGGQNVVEIIVSEKDLAAQSGMTRETVSREMKMLKDKGIVALNKNKLVIKDLQKLEEELSDGV